MHIISSQEVCVRSDSAQLLYEKPKVPFFKICCFVIQTPPKSVSQPSPNFEANMTTHDSPLIIIYFSLASVKLRPRCGANHVKIGEVFLRGRSSKFKALKQKWVGLVQGRENRPVYVGFGGWGSQWQGIGVGEAGSSRSSRQVKTQGFLLGAIQSPGRLKQWGDLTSFPIHSYYWVFLRGRERKHGTSQETVSIFSAEDGDV